MEQKLNREGWLHAFKDAVAPWFAEYGMDISKARLSCGWPHKGGVGSRARVQGQCWGGSASAEGVSEIFISPMEHETEEVAGIVVHELIHAALPEGTGHKGPFAKAAKLMLLEGKPTHAGQGEEFNARVAPILEALGPYPHAKLTPDSGKKQSTRMLKVSCAGCGYITYASSKWLHGVGAPLCPDESCDHYQMPMEEAE